MIGHIKFDPLMDECEAVVKRKILCNRLDEECVQARQRNSRHSHFVTGPCGTRRDDAVPVCFLPLKDRLVHLFRSPVECHKNLALWRGVKKYVLDGVPVLNERARTNIWDGDRVLNELLWFWDPNRLFMLPGFCEHCGVILSAVYIM